MCDSPSVVKSAITPVMLLLYLDDLFVTGMDDLIYDTKRNLAVEF